MSLSNKIALVALGLILLFAPLSINIGPVPITMQTFVIFVAASLLPIRQAVAIIAAYLLLGALGLPVFGNHSYGFSKLIGPTAGFLWGFVICAAYISWEAQRSEFHFFRGMLVFLQAHLILLIPGFLVLYYQLPELVLLATLVKLLPGLIVKSLLGGIIASQIRRRLLP
jgi:biotin transporter BioY